MHHKYKSFEDLPQGLKSRVLEIAHPDGETWVKSKVPALEGKSFMEVLNEENGYFKICEYLGKVEGYFR